MISIDDQIISEIYKISHDDDCFVESENDMICIIDTAQNPFIDTCMASLLPYFDNHHLYKKEMVKNKIMELLANLINADTEGKIKRFVNSCAKRNNSDFINLMMIIYSDPLTVKEFASRANMSLTSFKKTFNESPKKWINKKRLEKAHHILSNTDYSVTETCFLTGFGDLSYFIKSFKNKFGFTPNKMRKKSD